MFRLVIKKELAVDGYMLYMESSKKTYIGEVPIAMCVKYKDGVIMGTSYTSPIDYIIYDFNDV